MPVGEVECQAISEAKTAFVDGSMLSETTPDFCSNHNSVLASLPFEFTLAHISIGRFARYGAIVLISCPFRVEYTPTRLISSRNSPAILHIFSHSPLQTAFCTPPQASRTPCEPDVGRSARRGLCSPFQCPCL